MRYAYPARAVTAMAVRALALAALFGSSAFAASWGIEQRLQPSESGQFRQGLSVALSSDTALCGVPGAPGFQQLGAAYVFVRSNRTWVEAQKLTASDGFAEDLFGASVSIQGDLILVGAPTHETAYVFNRSGSSWVEHQKLTASDGVSGARFGSAVALSPTTILVGAANAKIGTSQSQGAVYVFTLTGSNWTEEQKVIAENGLPNDRLGSAVALSGDTALIGTLRGSPTVAGVAYVLVRAGGSFGFQQELASPVGPTDDPSFYDAFGAALALDGDTALLGAPGIVVNRTDNVSAAYVWTRTGTTWTVQQKLTSSSPSYSAFGGSVALQRDLAVLSAFQERAIYIFSRSDMMWAEDDATTGAMNAHLTGPVALSSDAALVAAPSDDAAYVLRAGLGGSATAGAGPAEGGLAPAAQGANAPGGCACKLSPMPSSRITTSAWLGFGWLLLRSRRSVITQKRREHARGSFRIR
jgi:hypothetical protein